jgi:hypothetical protein
VIGASGVNTVLVRNDFPELSSNLVSALSSLDMHDLSHGCRVTVRKLEKIFKLIATQEKSVKANQFNSN